MRVLRAEKDQDSLRLAYKIINQFLTKHLFFVYETLIM